MEKKEASVLIVVLLAFVLLAVHQIICAYLGTILRIGSITLAAVLLTVIFAGCLWILGKRNYIGWKQVLFLVFAVIFLVVIRFQIYRPEIIIRFTFNQNMVMNILYMHLQLVIGIGFLVSLKPKRKGVNEDK
ncbi:MAG: hypothetical protein GWN67_00955 [Phycisphaerae bacterium]|nr:hypothetical protein [Phycisphaerae bacterium]NIS49688.1 hypothetical protein [Phycisphaerae bacterium]NIU07420.1 hypothetical protein [Phycisphaerae bacterium]NIU55004.1 hypothetical protein [Phycisphaerae bacterium]NIW91477.1 hypothetical protein [Phycisphaerae bacterium]